MVIYCVSTRSRTFYSKFKTLSLRSCCASNRKNTIRYTSNIAYGLFKKKPTGFCYLRAFGRVHKKTSTVRKKKTQNGV